jgi:hypothetical protein
MKKKTDIGQNNKLKKNVRRIRLGVHRNRHNRAKVDRHLRALYDEIVKEGTPDRFARLLKQLERPQDEEEST